MTWEKFTKPDELALIADDDFGDIFIMNGREYQAYEDKKLYCDDQGNSIELRRVVIWNESTGRRIACVV